MDGIITINHDTDLVYSPDDSGWYFHRYGDDGVVSYSHTSQLFPTEAEALKVWRQGTPIEWKR